MARALLLSRSMTRFHSLLSILASISFVSVAACSSSSEPGDDTPTDEPETSVEGQALYRDASTDHSGNPRAAARPPEQAVDLRIDVRGTGTLEGLEPQCTLDGASGAFEGVYQGEITLDGDGLYAALLASTAATFETPSGCAIPTVSIGAMTEVVIHAEIAATTPSCTAFCEAHGRAEAEAECGATADAASCRAAAETSIAASCTASCTTETHRIVAETALSAEALAALNAGELTGSALGELDVDLVFDRVVDASGAVVVGP
jgi:hypothetical protein